MDKEKIMKLCQQIGLVAMSNKKHYPALHSDFDFINDAQMDIFREVSAPPKTNADRIRQMTDEELANFINDVTDCCSDGYICEKCPLNSVGKQCNIVTFEKWLKQEVSEDAGSKTD